MTTNVHASPSAVPPTAEDGGTTLLRWLRQMRDEHPVWRDAYGVWHVFRYADVASVISTPQLYSSQTARVVPSARKLTAGNLLQTDPPPHHQLRRLVGAAFSPKIVTRLAPHIAQLTHQLLDATGGAREFTSSLPWPTPCR